MSVILRPLKRKHRTTFQLDINHNGRSRVNLKGVFIYNNPATTEQRKHNQKNKAIAENMRSEKETSLLLNVAGKEALPDLSGSLIKYFEALNTPADRGGKLSGVIKHLKTYKGTPKTFAEVDENFAADFKKYLRTRVSEISAKNYFWVFRQALKRAFISKISAYDIRTFEDTRFNIDNSILEKETLEIEELHALAKAECDLPAVKHAFLFCCYTGLDFADMYSLKWSHIKAAGISKPRDKNSTKRLVPIHPTIAALLKLKDQKTEFVFQDLPDRGKEKSDKRKCYLRCLRALPALMESAGIEKHITFHCARHTFGTLAEGEDRTIARLMGHKGTRQVATYRRTKDAKMKASVDSLPAIHIPK